MKPWRLLPIETHNAAFNMAIDEAILEERIRGTILNTIRFYQWRPSAVSIGRFQDVNEQVNIQACRKNEVDIVRRISGGGAVYHDTNYEITYSVVVRQDDLGTGDIGRAYNILCSGLTEAANILGIEVSYDKGNYKQCPNLTAYGRKISGSSQAIRKGIILQHGTFLVDVNLRKMFHFLKVPWIKKHEDLLRVARRKITSITDELESKVTRNEVCDALIKGFKKALKINFSKDPLTKFELDRAKKLAVHKFSTFPWNFKGKTSN